MIILKGVKWDPGTKSKAVCGKCHKNERENRPPGSKYMPPQRSSTIKVVDLYAEISNQLVLNVLCAVCDFCRHIVAIHETDYPRYLYACGFNEIQLMDTHCVICKENDNDSSTGFPVNTHHFKNLFIGQCKKGHIWLAREVVGRPFMDKNYLE